MTSSKVLAAVHYGPGQVGTREVDRPEPGPGQVLVRVARAAICGSDLHNIFDGVHHPGNPGFPNMPAPGHPGHEAVGTVEESNSPDFATGDRVLVLSLGSFAQYMVAPASMCVLIPAALSFERALMAQQHGVTIYAMDQFWPRARPAEGVAVLIGAGSIGLHFLQVIMRRGFGHVIVSDRSEARLQAARELGASQVVLAPGANVVEAAMDATDGKGVSLAVEAAGYDETRMQAMSCVRRGGRVGLFGYPEGTEPSAFPFYDVFWKGDISIEIALGAQLIEGLPHFREAVGLIAGGEVNLDHHVGTEFPLADIGQALLAARELKALKVQVLP